MIASLLQESGELSSRFRFEALPHLWVVFLVLIPLAVLYGWLIYRGRSVPAGRTRWMLAGLRIAAILLLLLALFKPVMEKIRTREVRDQVLFLVDDSASMSRVGGYDDEEEAARIKAAAGLTSRENPSNISRLALAQRVLARQDGILDQLTDRFDLGLYSFSGDLVPIADTKKLTPAGRTTRVGEGLRAAFSPATEGRTAALVLVTDGRNNDGLSPLDAAADYASEGIPVHTIQCGITLPPDKIRNVEVRGIQAPDSILENEEATFKITLFSRGLARRHYNLSLVEMPAGTILATSGPGETLQDGLQYVTLRHKFTKAGHYTLEVRVDHQPGEAFTDDNRAVHHLNVISGPIRVLYVEDYPRYEYRYLKNALLRTDRSLAGQCFLLKASPDFTHEATEGVTPLRALPRNREEFLRTYHVVILGDVFPTLLGDTSQEAAQFLTLLKEFVEQGGGLICQAGVRANPQAYRDTPIADLLPVVLAEQIELMEHPQDRSINFSPQLENPGAPHEILKLLPDPQNNLKLWKEGLPGFFWYGQVRRAKAGATILLRHPERKNEYGRHVLAATWDYGQGRVMYLGLDSLWRWRKYYGDKHFDTFWRTSIRFASAGRLRRLNDRADLDLNKRTFEVDERVVLTVRLRDENLMPLTAETSQVLFTLPDGKTKIVNLTADKTTAGTFRGSARFRRPGNYAVAIHQDNDPTKRILARVGFTVTIPDKEMADPTPNPKLLGTIATETGGVSLTLSTAPKLLEILPPGGTRVVHLGKDPRPRDLWDTPWLILLFILLLGLEWAFRKAQHLP